MNDRLRRLLYISFSILFSTPIFHGPFTLRFSRAMYGSWAHWRSCRIYALHHLAGGDREPRASTRVSSVTGGWKGLVECLADTEIERKAKQVETFVWNPVAMLICVFQDSHSNSIDGSVESLNSNPALVCSLPAAVGVTEESA